MKYLADEPSENVATVLNAHWLTSLEGGELSLSNLNSICSALNI